MTDNHITFRLYIPLGMIILLMIMIFFHRNHMHKYLYIISSLCLFVAVLAYFAMTRHLAGDRKPGALMQAVPIIWLVGISGGYCRFYHRAGTKASMGKSDNRNCRSGTYTVEHMGDLHAYTRNFIFEKRVICRKA